MVILFVVMSMCVILIVVVSAVLNGGDDAAVDELVDERQDFSTTPHDFSTTALTTATTTAMYVAVVSQLKISCMIYGYARIAFDQSDTAVAFTLDYDITEQLRGSLARVAGPSSNTFLHATLAGSVEDSQTNQFTVEVAYTIQFSSDCKSIEGADSLRGQIKKSLNQGWQELLRPAGGKVFQISEPSLEDLAADGLMPDIVFGGPVPPIIISLLGGLSISLLFYGYVKCFSDREKVASEDVELAYFKLEALDMAMDWITFLLTYLEGDLEFRNDEHNVVASFCFGMTVTSSVTFLIELSLRYFCNIRPLQLCARGTKFSRKLMLIHFLFEDGCQACTYAMIAASQVDFVFQTPALAIALLQSIVFIMYKIMDIAQMSREKPRGVDTRVMPEFLT